MKHILIWLPVLLLAILCGCRLSNSEVPPVRKPEATAPVADPDAPSTAPKPWDSVSKQGQLYCSAESRDAAEEIAELYGITLVDYQNELALFFTEEDPQEVIRRGKENGWPLLSLNRTVNMY